MNINIILKDICEILNIEIPKIEYCDKSSLFSTKSTMSVVESTTRTIYINTDFFPETIFDLILVLAHECRHLYQIENNKFEFEKYKNANNLENSKYNEQNIEIDANAFACAYLQKKYKVIPLFSGFDEKTKKIIYEKAKEML